MTQFLPTFPAFITRRFSRTSNDEESPAINSPPPSSDTSAVASEDGNARLTLPLLEEEENSLGFTNQVGSSSLETQQQTMDIRNDPSLHHLYGHHENFNIRRTREHALRTEGDAFSSSSQASHALRSPASSISSSVPSAQDVPIDSTLPEDDGMAAMRARIVEIQNGPVSSEEKARQMLAVMTERYRVSQASLQAPRTLHESPSTSRSPEMQSSNSSNRSVEAINLSSSPPTSTSHASGVTKFFHLTAADRRPTYYQRIRRPSDGHGSSGRGLENISEESEDDFMPYGCPHYKRNIKLQCSTCSRWYTCRFCHDSVEDHKLVRRETKYMLCMFCNCAQDVSGVCVECGQTAAWYYCDVCKLWDDNPNRSIYHCNDCGICRVGEGLGKDFFHCKTCGVCLQIGIEDSHRCIERSTDCDCPICGEYMFTSPEKVVFMRCGHSIHGQCYQEHIRRSYRCPICSRSVVNMEAQFQHLKRLIAAQPMPSHLQDTQAWVYCNDCSAKGTVKYHWLGCLCDVCDSFNTALLRIFRIPGSDIPPSAGAVDDEANEQSLHASAYPLRPVSRGRSALSAGQALRSRRSVSAVETSITAQTAHSIGVVQRAARSASPTLQSRLPSSDTSDPSDSNDSDSDLEEVTFWGGIPSPAERLRSPSTNQGTNRTSDAYGSVASDSTSEEISDDEDYGMSENSRSDEGDAIDLVGHI